MPDQISLRKMFKAILLRDAGKEREEKFLLKFGLINDGGEKKGE